MSQHQMLTRSKNKQLLLEPDIDIDNDNNGDGNDPDTIEDNDIDEFGNIPGLIDYKYEKKKMKKFKKKSRKQMRMKCRSPFNEMNDMCSAYMLMNMMNGGIMNLKNHKINIKGEMKNTDKEDEDLDEDNESIDLTLESSDEMTDENSEENSPDGSGKNIKVTILDDYTSDEEDDDESSYDFDEMDEEFISIGENKEYDEDDNINYFHKLDKEKKESLLKEVKKVNEINDLNMPLKFKIYESDMDLNTKAIAIKNIEKLCEMDESSGEYSKMDKWISGLISIPFNKYINLSINNENTIDEKRDFILNTKSVLDKSIYGHNDAKTHILQVIGKWIKNPTSQGNVLALQGPMGNGKTTLVKEGISKAIGRPFSFIALGGQSDSAVFEGHSYTYEGSHWGRIIDILIESKCMNPVIYFDELDKVSESYKGEEIIHMLTHLTDPSQNTLFQDNYYPGINIDLSKVLFIFSFNDESKINRVLKDRMYVINTKGFNNKEKIKICREYVLPELYDTYLFKHEDIIINDDILEYVIDKYTNKEEGVRNLKRCIESIISKINIYYLTGDSNNIDLNFKIKDFKLPYIINREDIDNFLKINNSDQPPQYMYM